MNRELRFEAVDIDRGGSPVLRGIDLTLDAGRIAVIGANGSGKSTLARACNGLVTATRGTIRIHGLDPARNGREVRRRVGFVFSNPSVQILMPTVREDLAFTLSHRDLSKAEIATRVEAAIQRWGLDRVADSAAHELSGGQQQLLALASVLIAEPELVIADEPTALLDASNARRISRILLEEMPAQLLLVTHDLQLAARCEVAVRIQDGRVAGVGDPAEQIAGYLESLDDADRVTDAEVTDAGSANPDAGDRGPDARDPRRAGHRDDAGH